MFELKKVRRNIFHDTRVWCKIWRKADLWFGKWHEKFGKFSPEQTKFSKLGLSFNPFIQSRKCMSLKIRGDLCVMTMKNAKFEIQLTCYFKIDMRYLTNFDPSNQKNLHCNGLILNKVYNVSANTVQSSYVWLHSRLIQTLKENWLELPKIDVRNLANFHQSTWKSPDWDLDGILLSKVENVWALKFKGGLCVMTVNNDAKNWREIDLSVQKWHEEFDKFWPEHSNISKICTFIGCFWKK